MKGLWLLFVLFLVAVGRENGGLSRKGDATSESLIMRYHLSRGLNSFKKTFVLYTHNMKTGGTYLCQRALSHSKITFSAKVNCRWSRSYYLLSKVVSVDDVDAFVRNYTDINFVAIELTYNFWHNERKSNYLTTYRAYSEALMTPSSESIWYSMVTMISVRDPLARYVSLLIQMNYLSVNESTLEPLDGHNQHHFPIYDNSLVRHLIPNGDKLEKIRQIDMLVAKEVLDKYAIVLNVAEFFEQSDVILSCVLNLDMDHEEEFVRRHNYTELGLKGQTVAATAFFKKANKYDYEIYRYANSLLLDHYNKVKDRCD